MTLEQQIKSHALGLGFNLVGITDAQPLTEGESRLRAWLATGREGAMGYMSRTPERRARPADHLPGAQSVVCLGLNYYQPDPEKPNSGPARGRVSNYARAEDYHLIIADKLSALENFIRALPSPDGQPVRTKSCVDASPLLERELAQKAGLGFVGKNSCLITPEFGSWVFLAEVITTLPLLPDTPGSGTCGNCTRCLDVCPTQAFDDEWLLDARKCISYLTIELRAPIEPELRPAMGDWIFGCDLCQTICPYNKSPWTTTESRLLPDDPIEAAYPSLEKLFSYADEAEFKKDYADRPQLRPRRRAMIQSAAYAAANLHATELIPRLESLARADRDPLVRNAALHALEKLTTLPSKP